MANRSSQNGTNGASTTVTGSESAYTSSHGISNQGRAYPPLDSLVAQAEALVNQLDFHAPIRTILDQAHQLEKASSTHFDFGRPDMAYVEYLAASDLLINRIPHNKDYPTVASDRGELWRLNQDLRTRIMKKEQTFKDVKAMIQQSNARAALSKDPTSKIEEHKIQVRAEAPTTPKVLAKKRPPVQPKPQKLHGKSLHSDSPQPGIIKPSLPSSEPLTERFARLRGTKNPQESLELPPASHEYNNSSQNSPAPLRMPSVSDFIRPASPLPIQTNIDSEPSSPSKLIGPRDMPKPAAFPPHPPKIPLHVESSTLPRPPSPTYSPATAGPPQVVGFARSNARRQNGLDYRASSTKNSTTDSSRASTTISRSSSAQSYGTNGESTTQSSSRPSRVHNRPMADTISVQLLRDYLSPGADQLKILIIDIRERSQFDDGHIFSRNIVCIEPPALRDGLSADELEEALIVSPEAELDLFARRTSFDIVVFYDQSTTARQYDNRSSKPGSWQALRNFRETLELYSYESPLQQRPLLLDGGLDAWKDYVGPQALATSQTINLQGGPVRNTRSRYGTDFAQVPISLHGSQSTERRPRPQSEQNGSSSHPESFYHEEDQGTRYKPPSLRYSRVEEDLDEVQSKQARRQASIVPRDDDPSYIHSYDDFLRRYPEPFAIQESMVVPAIRSNRPRPPVPLSPSQTIVASQHDQKYNTANWTESNSTRYDPPPDYQDNLPRIPSRPPPVVPRTSYSGVSPHAPSQISASSQSLAYAPRVPIGPGRVGLDNMGNTCYMNSVLQCLSASTPLTAWIFNGGYLTVTQRDSKGLAKQYTDLIKRLRQVDTSLRSYRPAAFRTYCRKVKRDWDNSNQQDANDFYMWLVDALHDEFNVNAKRNPLQQLTSEQEDFRERLPMQVASIYEWDRYLQRNCSFISATFMGQYASKLTCATCQNTSTTYETFTGIPLEIPKTSRGDIHQCLRNWSKSEQLRPEDMWKCPKCKINKNASKQITITRAPHILVLQLKRFSSPTGGKIQKLTTDVSFPLNCLDLGSYMVPPIDLGGSKAARFSQEHGQNLLDRVLKHELETSPPYHYELYGVVQHFGSLTSGHYVALIRGQGGQWWEHNDSHVSKFNTKKVETNAAYILFYQRINGRT